MITLGIVSAMVLLAILVSLQMYFNQNLFLKLIVVTYLFLIASIAYFSFDSYFGWPIDEKILNARVIGIEIVEPTPKDKGAIYLWVYDIKRGKSFLDSLNYNGFGKPRAYFMEYTQAKGEKLLKAKEKMESGMLVFITDEEDPTNSSGNGEGVELEDLPEGDGDSESKKDKNGGRKLGIVNPKEYLQKAK